jgi:hypothetical protein
VARTLKLICALEWTEASRRDRARVASR